MFPFVEGDVFVGVVGDKNINICSSFDVMNSINDVYVGVLLFFGVLITDEAICPLIVCPLIFMSMTPLCLGVILRVDFILVIFAFCSQFLV